MDNNASVWQTYNTPPPPPGRALLHARMEISDELLLMAQNPGELITNAYSSMQNALQRQGAIGPLRFNSRRDGERSVRILSVDEMPNNPTASAGTNYIATINQAVSRTTAGGAMATGYVNYVSGVVPVIWPTINPAVNYPFGPVAMDTMRPDSHPLERSLELLYHNLSDAQREQYIDKKYFEVVGKHSKAIYRIYRASAGNVAMMYKNGTERARYCLAVADGAPVYDLMLAEKLLIETDEQRFLKTANRSAGRN